MGANVLIKVMNFGRGSYIFLSLMCFDQGKITNFKSFMASMYFLGKSSTHVKDCKEIIVGSDGKENSAASFIFKVIIPVNM